MLLQKRRSVCDRVSAKCDSICSVGRSYRHAHSLLCPSVWVILFFYYMFDEIMMIMRNPNRLINNFKEQTKDTVWKFLDAMAVNYAVYSTRLKGLSLFLSVYDVYVYCNATNVVIVCLDCCEQNNERMYAESDALSSMLFDNGLTPQVSVVWKLKETVRLAQSHLRDVFPGVNVHGVLLTEAEILNADELCSLWDANGITVIDGLKRLKYKNIRTNEDDELACKDYLQLIADATYCQDDLDWPKAQHTVAKTSDKLTSTDAADDEFEKMLTEFINKEFEEAMDNSSSAEQEQSGQDDNEEEEDNVEDCEDSTEDEVQFPTGEIEQNNNISVKVEILRPIPHPREELDRLVGCANIKQRMDELVALTSYNKMMRHLFPDCKQHAVSLHSVFLGRPGTGKTTVCKIYGSLLRQAGALSKGHVVVCDRGTFIGTLWGDEERSVRQVLEMAQGGVLMIDEAYLLNGKNDNDPGKMVMHLLMSILADESQRDIAVVLCGYKEPMMKLLDTNPGLQSRFANKFEFSDFTVDELLEITRRKVEEYHYWFAEEAWEKYKALMSQAYQQRNPDTWGNARFVANQLERIYIQHAARCVRLQLTNKRDLLMLAPEDIVPIEFPRQKAKIGF